MRPCGEKAGGRRLGAAAGMSVVGALRVHERLCGAVHRRAARGCDARGGAVQRLHEASNTLITPLSRRA